MRAPKIRGPKLAKPPTPPAHGPGNSVRPRLHTPSHLRLAGKSAFPAAPIAMGPPAMGGGPAFGGAAMAAAPGPAGGAAPGDQGE